MVNGHVDSDLENESGLGLQARSMTSFIPDSYSLPA